jgi:hypothetical protein
MLRVCLSNLKVRNVGIIDEKELCSAPLRCNHKRTLILLSTE